MTMPMNPRVQRDELAPFVGKKVTIGTRSYHYVSGVVEAIRKESDQLAVRVHGQIVLVPLDEIATIQEAPAAQAEYVK
jgi:hypothetical protein